MTTKQTTRPSLHAIQSFMTMAAVLGIVAVASVAGAASKSGIKDGSAAPGVMRLQLTLVTLDRSKATDPNPEFDEVWQRGLSKRSTDAALKVGDQTITATQLLNSEFPDELESMIEVVALPELAPTTNSSAMIGAGRKVPYFEPLKNGDFRLRHSERREGITITVETGTINADRACEISSLSFEESRVVRRIPIYQVDLDAGYPVIEQTAAATYRAFTLSPDEAALIGLTVLDDGREVFLIMTATAEE